MRNRFAHQRIGDGIETDPYSGLQVVARTALVEEQRFHLPLQICIAVASRIQQASALRRIAFRNAMKQLLDLRPAFRSHEKPNRPAFPYAATLPPSLSHDVP